MWEGGVPALVGAALVAEKVVVVDDCHTSPALMMLLQVAAAAAAVEPEEALPSSLFPLQVTTPRPYLNPPPAQRVEVMTLFRNGHYLLEDPRRRVVVVFGPPRLLRQLEGVVAAVRMCVPLLQLAAGACPPLGRWRTSRHL